MALSSMPLTQFQTGTIKFLDGTGAALSATLQLDQGAFSVSGIKAGLREVTAYETRGVLIATRRTTRIYPTGSFNAMVAEMSEAAAGTVLDMIHGTAGTPYATRVSTRAGDAMCLDIELAVEGTDYGGVDMTMTFEDCDISWDYSQGDPDQLSFSFTCYGDITGDLAIAED